MTIWKNILFLEMSIMQFKLVYPNHLGDKKAFSDITNGKIEVHITLCYLHCWWACEEGEKQDGKVDENEQRKIAISVSVHLWDGGLPPSSCFAPTPFSQH